MTNSTQDENVQPLWTGRPGGWPFTQGGLEAGPDLAERAFRLAPAASGKEAEEEGLHSSHT